MSSTIFYKFLHQKTQSTIHFDGTGISVFDLKHEIITQNQLGQGNDFNLSLFHSENPEIEYDNDQDVISRSTFVLAKRSPSLSKNGKFNNASRYVSGKPRVIKKAVTASASAGVGGLQGSEKPIDENLTEEEKIKLMFENQNSAWAQAQDELSTHKAVYNKPTATSNPEDIPPPGYVCYRCGAKDHWIRNCPTNNDPNFEGKKIKRTTGIPKSYLKTISKEAATAAVENGENADGQFVTNENGDLVDSQGNTYMINENGEYVIALADSKTWLNYQQKQQNAAAKAKSEYEQKIIECMESEGRTEFLDPLAEERKRFLQSPIVMTPCCQSKESLNKMKNFNYNQTSLEQLLIDNDFICPNCGSEDVFIDSLIRNKDLEESLKLYLEQKNKELGLEDPDNVSLKRKAEESVELDPKRRHFPMIPPGMPLPVAGFPLPSGMPVPPMPLLNSTMPIPPPIFMPPIPPPFPIPNTTTQDKK